MTEDNASFLEGPSRSIGAIHLALFCPANFKKPLKLKTFLALFRKVDSAIVSSFAARL